MALPRIRFGDPETVAIELSDDMVFVEQYKGRPAAVYMPKKHLDDLQTDQSYVSPLPKPTLSDENTATLNEIVSTKFHTVTNNVSKALSVLSKLKVPKGKHLNLRLPVSPSHETTEKSESIELTTEKVNEAPVVSTASDTKDLIQAKAE